MADLVVVTGGSHSGKTSVIRELSARGHQVIPEAALEVIEELIAERGAEAQVQWRRSHQIDFQRRISERQCAREVAARCAPSKFVFCDRGLLDGSVYCRLAGVEWPDDLRMLAESARYAHVFVLATLANFDLRSETGRVHSEEESIRAGVLLRDVYRPRTRNLTPIPEAPVSARAELMLQALGLPTGR